MMVYIIHVQGKTDSGKTSSIRRFIEHQNIILPANPRDIQLIITIVKHRKPYKIGIASGGDTPNVINSNFDFFRLHDLDFIICPTKLRGNSEKAFKDHIDKLTVTEIIPINTINTYDPDYDKNHQEIANHIWNEIWNRV